MDRARCTLRCLTEPSVYIDPDGVRHYAVEGAIDYALATGGVTAECQLFFRADAAGELKRASMRQMPRGMGIYADLPLFHWVGSHVGPYRFGTKRRVSLVD